MRTLAIGDIHGCSTALKKMWEVLDPKGSDHVIFLGDYVDRGPDSKGVIDFLIEIELKKCYQLTFLTGNHEEKFFMSKQDPNDLAHWLQFWGGRATLRSYDGSIHNVPQAHWDFLRKAKTHYETETHIFVHANLEADVEVNVQQPYTILHKKFGTPLPHMSGKIMVCGHTAQKNHKPLHIGHAVCIDTDTDRGGWLTCLHVETNTYWQTNENQELRIGKLSLPHETTPISLKFSLSKASEVMKL
jgi:serine/threonine protein phosphatase 1